MKTDSWKSGSGSTTQPHSKMSKSPVVTASVSWSSEMTLGTTSTPTSLNHSWTNCIVVCDGLDSLRAKNRKRSGLLPSGIVRMPSLPRA